MGDLKMAGSDSYIWTNGSGSGYTGLWDAANGRVAWKYVEGGDLQLLPSAGNVGIGSTSPSARLDIVGSSVAKPGIEINTTDTGDTNFGMVIKGATNTERAIGFYDNNALAWWFGRDNGGDIQNGIGFGTLVLVGLWQ